MIEIRRMESAEIERIREIDRSEQVTHEYTYRRGVLERRAFELAVPNWSPSGEGEHTIPRRVGEWRPILERGGTLLGAFDGDLLAGFAIYRPRLAPDMGNLSALFVSRGWRRTGIAARLLRAVAGLARADGARRLYVSATPSNSAVGFYLTQGFVPTDEPDAAMLAHEPDDIHMILEL